MKKLYAGKIVNLVVDHVRYDSGNESVREIIEHPGGSVVLAVFENNDILLVRQFRYPIGGEVIELPAGKLDAKEDPQHCAERELREETGYISEAVDKTDNHDDDPGILQRTAPYLYGARPLVIAARTIAGRRGTNN